MARMLNRLPRWGRRMGIGIAIHASPSAVDVVIAVHGVFIQRQSGFLKLSVSNLQLALFTGYPGSGLGCSARGRGYSSALGQS